MKRAIGTTLLPLLLLHDAPIQIQSVPLIHTIPNSKSSCFYEKLEADEHLTMSVFVTSGAELRATATLEGPIAPPEVSSGIELDAHIKKYTNGERFSSLDKLDDDKVTEELKVARYDEFDERGNLFIEEHVDFEHARENFYGYDDDTDEIFDDFIDDDDDDASAAMMKRRTHGQEKVMRQGDPWERTVRVISPGWYRGCVTGSWYQISAEIQLRKSSELGIFNKRLHVNTFEENEIYNENEELDKNMPDDPDLTNAKNQLKMLNRLINSIRAKQGSERRKLEVHAAMNEHSHSKMVLSSLMETVLFIVVTGFQIYTIRTWFTEGEPMLGK